ncbi:MAG: diacylglycerol kinase family lipid kinase [Candidatus Methylomirabilis sp.]|nr:diacylglycerol kinase family lipid kinase [Deltaproteobacteria bacterium]
MPRTLVIVNPKSAAGKTGREWGRLERDLRGVLGDFDARLTERPRHAGELAREGLKEGYELIVSAGGDGTNFEVVNGWFEEDKAVNPAACFATLPLGTGGDFRKSLGIPRDPIEAAKIIREAPARPIDAARLGYTTMEGRPASCHFINIADLGIGGEASERVNRTSKRFGGFVSFLWATSVATLLYKNKRVRYRLDDGPWMEETVYSLNCANGRFFGGGMEIAPEGKLDDGLFEVVILGDMTKPQVFRETGAVYKGRRIEHPLVRYARARKVEATSREDVLLDVDGEVPGKLPATFEILPGAINVRGRF